MATKSKTGTLGRNGHTPGPPKKTSIGQGQNSRPRNRKKLRGQGK